MRSHRGRQRITQILALASLLVGSVPSPLAAFSYLKAIRVDHARVVGGSDLSDYPLLFSVTDPDLRGISQGGHVTSVDGHDIRFRSFDDAVCGGPGLAPCTLDQEVEAYDGVNGTLVAWVRIPVLSASTDTTLYIAYGDSSVTTTSDNRAGVWRSGHDAAWHLEESPADGETDAHLDATDTAHHGTPLGFSTGPGSGSTDVAGQVSGADQFGGDDDLVRVSPVDSTFALDAESGYTWSMWIQPLDLSTEFRALWNQSQSDGKGVSFWAHSTNDGRAGPVINGVSVSWHDGSHRLDAHSTDGALRLGEWQHLAITYNGSVPEPGRFTIYVNGADVSSRGDVQSAGTLRNLAPVNVTIGGDTLADEWFSGSIDEVRYARRVRTAGWIATEYDNHRQPGDVGAPGFYTLGIEEPNTAVNPNLLISAAVPDPTEPTAVAVGDLNLDGLPDLVTTHPPASELSLFLATGANSYAPPVRVSMEGVPLAMATGDMNGDGNLDVVVGMSTLPGVAGASSDLSAGAIEILYGNGGGGVTSRTLADLDTTPISIVLLDLDLDSHLDAAVAAGSGAGIVILTGDPEFGFDPAVSRSLGGTVTDLAVGDIDGDGDHDLVAVMPASGECIVLLTDDSSTLRFPAGTEPRAVSVGDLDLDGRVDIAIADTASNEIVILVGDPLSVLGPPRHFPALISPVDLAMTELTSDCYPDIAARGSGSTQIVILVGEEGATLGAPIQVPVASVPGGLAPLRTTTGDLAVSRPGRNDIVILTNEAARMLDFTANLLDLGCGMTAMELHATASGVESRSVLDWDFGDGSPMVQQVEIGSLIHVYVNPGLYTVTVHAEDAAGACVAQVRHEVDVPARIVPSPGGPYAACAGPAGPGTCLTLDARGTVFGDPAQAGSAAYEWRIGGHVVGNAALTTWCVDAGLGAGALPAEVAVTLDGCEQVGATTIELGGRAPAVAPAAPTACSHQTVRLTAEAGYASYLWSTGEDVRSIEVVPDVDTDYLVTAVDAWGCPATTTVRVTVQETFNRGVDELWLVKRGAAVEIHYAPADGADRHELYAAESPAELGGMAPVLSVPGESPFVFNGGVSPLYFAVHGVSTCTPRAPL